MYNTALFVFVSVLICSLVLYDITVVPLVRIKIIIIIILMHTVQSSAALRYVLLEIGLY